MCSLTLLFVQVRVDVSARNPGKVQAALTETRRGLTELALEPLREEYYYEVHDKLVFFFFVQTAFHGYSSYNGLCGFFPQKREPFSPLSLVKSPMGLMVGFMLLVVFVMPKLMENMGKSTLNSNVHLFCFASICDIRKLTACLLENDEK